MEQIVGKSDHAGRQSLDNKREASRVRRTTAARTADAVFRMHRQRLRLPYTSTTDTAINLNMKHFTDFRNSLRIQRRLFETKLRKMLLQIDFNFGSLCL